MDIESLRAFLLSLPHVTETVQWGDSLVYWAADKAIGGRMFAVAGLAPERGRVLSFAAGPERFAALIEREGLFPAPYLARAHWVAVSSWTTLSGSEMKELLHHARELVFARLPAKTRTILAMPPAAQKKLIAQRKKLLSSRGPTR